MLMAMALVRLQAVKRVPSRTLLFGAHVILILVGVLAYRCHDIAPSCPWWLYD